MVLNIVEEMVLAFLFLVLTKCKEAAMEQSLL